MVGPVRDKWASRRKTINKFCVEVIVLSRLSDSALHTRVVVDQITREMRVGVMKKPTCASSSQVGTPS